MVTRRLYGDATCSPGGDHDSFASPRTMFKSVSGQEHPEPGDVMPSPVSVTPANLFERVRYLSFEVVRDILVVPGVLHWKLNMNGVET